MPRREANLRLQDIVEAIDRILEYTASLSLESFKADTRTVDAVVRNLEVIGEAARGTSMRIPPRSCRRYPGANCRRCEIF